MKHQTSNIKHQISCIKQTQIFHIKHQTNKNNSYQVSNIEHQASSIKHQTSNIKHQTSNIKHQTSNIKHQTSKIKHQAPSIKHQWSSITHQASKIKHQTSSIKHQASSIRYQASNEFKKHTKKQKTSKKNVSIQLLGSGCSVKHSNVHFMAAMCVPECAGGASRYIKEFAIGVTMLLQQPNPLRNPL